MDEGGKAQGVNVLATNSIQANALRACTSTHQECISAYSSGMAPQFMGTWRRQRAVENELKAGRAQGSDGIWAQIKHEGAYRARRC